MGFRISMASGQWSHDGRFVTLGSSEQRNLNILQVDRQSQECMWSIFDAMRTDADFWKQYPIDLKSVQETT